MKGRVGRVRRRLQWRCPWEHQLRWAAGRALRSNPITCRDSAKQRALPLRLRTAVRAEQQAWGSLALLDLLRAGLLEPPERSVGETQAPCEYCFTLLAVRH